MLSGEQKAKLAIANRFSPRSLRAFLSELSGKSFCPQSSLRRSCWVRREKPRYFGGQCL